jgi:hypothetical protein
LNRVLLRYRLAKLRRLNAAELSRLVRAQLALCWAALVVRTRPTGQLVQRSAGATSAAEPTAERVRDARSLALAVERAAEHGLFRATCLIRSVALQHLLQRRGITGGRIQIGVRMDGGQFLAHAWVEWNGEVLGDRVAHTATFAQLCDVDLAHLP